MITSTVAETFDENYCYFQRENLTNFHTGEPFKLPFFISFIEVATVSRKHLMEAVERPDQFRLTLSLISEPESNVKRILYSEKLLAIDGLYDSGAEYIVPSSVPEGNYRFHVEFDNLDKLEKKTSNVSPVFRLKSGSGKYDHLFVEQGDGSGTIINKKRVAIYFKTEKGLNGPERMLISQTFRGNRLVSTDRIAE